jgi:hypothetical protein
LADQVVLADRAFDRDGMPGYVRREGGVGAIDFDRRSAVCEDREFSCGDGLCLDPTHGPHGASTGHEDRRPTAVLGEDPILVHSASMAR